MTTGELDAKIDAIRASGREAEVIVIERGALMTLAEELKAVERFVFGECTTRITTGPDGKYSFKPQTGYPSGLQVAAYKGIPVIWYTGALADSICSELAQSASTVVA